MRRFLFSRLAVLALIQFILGVALCSASLAQEWKVRGHRGTLRVLELREAHTSLWLNYAEGLVTLDKDNNVVPCLAEDWRWVSERTIEFRLREAVRFHNGEKFDAEAVRVNWEAYKSMQHPRFDPFLEIPDEAIFEILDDYRVRFTFPEPDGLALVKFRYFVQIAPTFYKEHQFKEKNYGRLPGPGPWGTGPFKLVEGVDQYGRTSPQWVLEANEDYWDARYPKLQKVIFDNTLQGDRDEAMRLCREEEEGVDLVSFIRPLDTLKVAESPYAKVVKSKDISWLGVGINQRKRDSKFRDIRVRKALNCAVNRKELWKYAARGNAYNLDGWVLPFPRDPNEPLYTYDTDKARSLLAEAGYSNGFEVNMITYEGWKLEAQIISKMLERIGLKGNLDVLTRSDFLCKTYQPLMDKPFEEQEWDLAIDYLPDWAGHIGASWYPFGLKDSDFRANEYDPIYDQKFWEMAKTVDKEAQEDKLRQLANYSAEHAFSLSVYSPITLYAVNKEVNFVPHKSTFLLLKGTSVTDNHWSVRGENQ